MAHLDNLPIDLLRRVAREIGLFIDKTLTDRSKASKADVVSPLDLGETLTVWRFTSRAFEVMTHSELSGDLSEWVEQTPFLYHQIRLKGKAAGFARSYLKEGIEERAVFQIEASSLASDMSNLFELIERNATGDLVIAADPVVRLLEIPSFQIFVLWLFSESRRESRVVIIQAAERYQELIEGRILNSAQFFKALSIGPISDIT